MPGQSQRPAERAAGLASRVRRAWRALGADQRLAGTAAIVLGVSLFLPWYEKSVLQRGTRGFLPETLSAFDAPFVALAVVLVVVGVLALLLARGERRAFHLPGGDGLIVTLAGLWGGFLVVYRVFDKPRPSASEQAVTVGLRWGIFVALAAAAVLAYAGLRMRASHRPEPPLREPGGGRPSAGGTPAEVWLSDERPHLDETEVMGSAPTQPLGRRGRQPGQEEGDGDGR